MSDATGSVHTAPPGSGDRDLALLVLALAATLAGLPVLYLALRAGAAWPALLGAHLGIALACLTWLLTCLPGPPEQPPGALEAPPDPFNPHRLWGTLLVAASALSGSLGCLCVLLGFCVYRIHARHSRPFEEWYAELFPEAALELDERIYDELLLTAAQREHPSRVTPFADVMNYGTKEQKELAINMMRRYFEAPFAPILTMALDDSNNSVRIQAATAITHLESRFAERAAALEESVQDTPTPQNVFELAWHLDRYAFSGLLDVEPAARMRKRALVSYERYVQAVPRSLQARIALGRLLLRSGEPQAARDALQRAREELGPEPRLDAWLMECCFACSDYGQLRELASAAASAPRSAPSQIIGPAARMWAGIDPVHRHD